MTIFKNRKYMRKKNNNIIPKVPHISSNDQSKTILSGNNRRSFIKKSLMLGVGGLFGGVGALGFGGTKPTYANAITTNSSIKRRKLKPVLDSDYWLIGLAPTHDLKPESSNRPIEPVDHHILKADDGNWHLWSCVRYTEFGRILYHWKAKSLEERNWEPTGEMIRCNFDYGECIDDWEYYGGKEWIQSPYFVRDRYGKYYMFYGGHSTGYDIYGNPAPGNSEDELTVRKAQCQICLMTSDDGLNWSRYKNKDGYSRVVVGPGEARGAFIINIDGLWHMYYAAEEHFKIGGFYLRTSDDLYTWSDYELVHYDPTFGKTTWDHECASIEYREGYFYLFKTEDYRNGITHVYRSKNHRYFGIGAEDAQPLYVGTIKCASPQRYWENGQQYMSSNHNPRKGIELARIKWIPDES